MGQYSHSLECDFLRYLDGLFPIFLRSIQNVTILVSSSLNTIFKTDQDRHILLAFSNPLFLLYFSL